ncbi:phospholipase C [Sphingomonas sp. PvP055]
MERTTRRHFLRAAGAGVAVAQLPGLIERALAVPANRRTGTLRDVEHVVIHMQENRAFDHYLGKLNGVRGFGDPRPLRLAGGRSVWAQPSVQHPDGHVLPFHGDSRTTRALTVDGAEQSHPENVHIFNRGRYDRWGHSGALHTRMLHYTASDLPFYYALADAFTVCDAYHCSTMTQTYPNRLHLFSGCNGGGTVGGDPQMHNYGEDETPSADMAEDRPLRPDAYRWTTYAERLQAAGIDWKVYQEYDNFGDNLLSIFPPFRPCARDSELYRRGRSWVSEHKPGADRKRSDGEQLVEAFRRDVAGGTLPQVSWIVTAADLSEHPTAEPSKGEHVTAQLIEALVDHPDVFAKTVFLLVYDEAGGFYDHVPPPVPPVGRLSRAQHRADRGRDQGLRRGHCRGCGQAPDRAGHPHAGDRGIAVEPGRLRLFRTVRPHLGAALPGGAVRRHGTQYQRVAAIGMRGSDLGVRLCRIGSRGGARSAEHGRFPRTRRSITGRAGQRDPGDADADRADAGPARASPPALCDRYRRCRDPRAAAADRDDQSRPHRRGADRARQ